MTRQGPRSPFKDELYEDADDMLVCRSVQDIADQSRTSETLPLIAPHRSVGVVIACFDTRRMGLLQLAVQSVREQDYPHELTVVVDYNEELYQQLHNSALDNVSVIRNTRSRGAAGARNTAALMSDNALIAFMDDDACAQAGWLRSLVRAMQQPGVVGVGGRILPRWQQESPRWFPPEFGWVVGASIGDAGDKNFPVRNVWSGSMMVDREAFQKVEGFREGLSKVGGAARPEDTELCLRLTQTYGPVGQWLMVPAALVEHYVPAHRATLRYVMNRCWAEGAGKVHLRAMSADRSRALADEKLYLSKAIPRALWSEVLQSLRLRRLDGLMRAGTILLGVGAAVVGAIVTGLGAAFGRHPCGESS